MSIATEAIKLRAGVYTFEQFLKRTKQDWVFLAVNLLRHWAAPVEVEDVVQDLMMSAWLFYPKYDHTRGVEIGTYLIYNSVDKAKKRLHQYRDCNRHGNADAAQSRLPILVDSYDLLVVGTMYMETEEHMSGLKLLADRFPYEDGRIIARCVVETRGDLEYTAEVVYSDPDLRATFRLGDLAEARTLTRKVFGWMKREVMAA